MTPHLRGVEHFGPMQYHGKAKPFYGNYLTRKSWNQHQSRPVNTKWLKDLKHMTAKRSRKWPLDVPVPYKKLDTEWHYW